jgi:phosphatidylethanolamine-binding protein (PEBP) family uncharacterized protein
MFAAVPSSAQAGEFSASFRWCEPISNTPSFVLSGVPKGTVKLTFHMSDHQAAFNHWGGSVTYHGQKAIPCGAFNGEWIYPQPPNGPHTYEFDIRALDSAGREIGKTNPTRTCCS